MSAAATIHLHGVPHVLSASGAAVPLSAREAALLAWLHLEGATPRATLAGRLWPGGDDAKARANLRQTLVRLKRGAGELLAEHDGVLQLAAGVQVASAEPAGAARLLGPIEFDDAPELAEWLQQRREAAERDRLRERLRLGRAAVEQGALDEALAVADAVLADDGAVEEAHRLRMQVFYLRGDRAAAVAAWDACRLALRAAYGMAPSAATNELGRLVLATEAASRAPAAVAVAALPLALRRPPRLVGREAEREALIAALSQGQGAVVAAAGGVGKSRLLAEVAAALEPAVQVGARPGDAVLPGVLASRLVAAAVERFAPVLDSVTQADIARLLPGGADPAAPQASALEHRRVLASVARTMLACHARGMRLVVVDDLQFADELSLEAIGVVMGAWLAAPPGDTAVALFGCRPDELTPAGLALVRLMDGSRRSLRLELGPLRREDLRTLLDSLPLPEADSLDRDALAAALHAQVGGNPAFVLECLRGLWQSGLAAWRPGLPLPVPATLVESVRLRLQRLSPDALQLAQLAAIARGDFSLGLAAAAFGRAPLALSPLFAELEAAQVLDGTGFSHDLVGQAVRQSMPDSLVAPLHRLVAEHLRGHDGPPASVAAHLHAAGQPREAAQWHLRAGQRALARWQLAQAAASFEAALDGLDQASDRAQALLAGRDAARAWLWLSRHAEAARVLDRVEPLARSAADRVRLAAVRQAWLHNSRQLDAAVPHARALAADLLAAQQLEPADLLRGLRGVTVALPMVGEGEEALRVLQQLLPRLDLSQPATAAEFQLVHGSLLCRLDRVHEARPVLQAALQGARAAGQLAQVVGAGAELARATAALGHTAEALDIAEATLAVVVDQQFGAGFEADLRSHMALMHAAVGQPARATAQLEAAAALYRPAGRPMPPMLQITRALVLAELGRLDEAVACLGAVPEPAADDQVTPTYRRRVQRRLRLLGRGDRATAEPPAGPHTPLQLAEALMQAQASAPAGVAEAQRWCEQAREQALRAQERQALQQLARAALAVGDQALAAASADQAWRLPDAVDGWFDSTASRWLDAAEVLQACGQADAAAAALEAGRRWVQQAVADLPDEAARRAWTEGHPLHARLLQRRGRRGPDRTT